jgi:hypothetical protein
MEVAPVHTLDPVGAETLTVGLARNDDVAGRSATSVQLATSASGGPVADWSTSLAPVAARRLAVHLLEGADAADDSGS